MQRLVVLGAGESGVGTAILGKQKKYQVFVSDNGQIEDKYKNVLEHFEIEWEEGGHTEEKILNATLVMKSPGIPDKVHLIQKLLKSKIPVISEIEFAAQYTDATLIGITGSNGKTTTTMLTQHVLQGGGLNSGMAGNIGDSFAKMVAEEEYDNYVLEISSFQLDGIVDFRPQIAIITNITPDHLDRYEYQFENYVASKFRIAMNQGVNDYLIYDADDPVIVQGIQQHSVQSKLVPFSVQTELKEGAWLENNEIIINVEHKNLKMSTDYLALDGQHNVKNAMAATLASLLVNVRKETLRQSIESFQGVPHRLEKVLKINHVCLLYTSDAADD